VTVVELPPQLAPRVDDLALASRVTRDPGGGAVVWLSGEHDLTTRRQLCDVLAFEFSVDDSDVIVDLSDVTFMDCSTVGVLIGGKEWMAAQQRWMSVRAPSRCARRLLDLSGLNRLLDTRPSAMIPSLTPLPAGPQPFAGRARRAG